LENRAIGLVTFVIIAAVAVVLLGIGSVLFVSLPSQINQCDSILGQGGQIISPTVRQQCDTAKGEYLLSLVLLVLGLVLIVIGIVGIVLTALGKAWKALGKADERAAARKAKKAAAVFCRHCGKAKLDDSDHCRHCGKIFSWASSESVKTCDYCDIRSPC
jgi:hypothetical protein